MKRILELLEKQGFGVRPSHRGPANQRRQHFSDPGSAERFLGKHLPAGQADPAALATLSRKLAAGELVLLVPSVSSSLDGRWIPIKPKERAPVPAAAAPLTVEKEMSFVEFLLVGEDDLPIAGARAEVTLPDGKKLPATTDGNGLIRVADLDGGECSICFVDLDGESWAEG